MIGDTFDTDDRGKNDDCDEDDPFDADAMERTAVTLTVKTMAGTGVSLFMLMKPSTCGK